MQIQSLYSESTQIVLTLGWNCRDTVWHVMSTNTMQLLEANHKWTMPAFLLTAFLWFYTCLTFFPFPGLSNCKLKFGFQHADYMFWPIWSWFCWDEWVVMIISDLSVRRSYVHHLSTRVTLHGISKCCHIAEVTLANRGLLLSSILHEADV